MNFSLAPAQKRMWFLSQLESRSIAYNNCVVYAMQGNIDVPFLTSCIERILIRHEIIRSKYFIHNGDLLQQYDPSLPCNIYYLDLEQASDQIQIAINETAHKYFDLEKGDLHEIKIIKEKESSYLLVTCFHHIISDGRSFQILMDELWLDYNRQKLPDLTHQYHEYSKWINEKLSSSEKVNQKEYWLNEFQKGDIVNLHLPADFKRPDNKQYQGERIFFDIGHLSNTIKQIAFKNRTTISVFFLTCYAVFLHKLSGQSKIIIGVPTEGRDNPYNKLFGMYVNTLPIKIEIIDGTTFADQLKNITKTFFNAYKNQDYPFEELVYELKLKRDSNRNPLFDVLYTHQIPLDKKSSDELEISSVTYDKKTSQFDLSFETFENLDKISALIEYDTELFSTPTIEKFRDFFLVIVDVAVHNSSILLSDISILTDKGNENSAEEFWNRELSQLETVTTILSEKSLINYKEEEKFDKCNIHIPSLLIAQIIQRAKELNVSTVTIIQCAWAYLLFKYTQTNHVCFGTTNSVNKERYQSVENIYDSIIPAIIHFEDNSIDIDAYIEKFNEEHKARIEYGYISLASIQNGNNIKGESLFDNVVIFKKDLIANIADNPDQYLNQSQSAYKNIKLALFVGSENEFKLFYKLNQYDKNQIERISGHFINILESIVSGSHTDLKSIDVLSSDERQKILFDWNDTKVVYPLHMGMHQLFEEYAKMTPNAIALIHENESLSYAELNNRSNQFANFFKEHNVIIGSKIGICAKRSVTMLVSIIGALKHGCAYVPLDPSFPADRLQYMLYDSEATTLVGDQDSLKIIDSVKSSRIGVYSFEKIQEMNSAFSKQYDFVGEDNEFGNRLAYVLYTSGSTGKPKGVQIRHENVVNFLLSMKHTPGLYAKDILCAITTISFDISILELFLPLSVGASVILSSDKEILEIDRLVNTIKNNNATVMQATPATWRMLLESGWKNETGIKILCGGEALDLKLAEALLQYSTEVWNLYGPTETTIWSSIKKIESGEKRITIGRPIDNTEFYILDTDLKPVPIGVSGSLYIGGAGVSTGYLGQRELTDQKFIDNPFYAIHHSKIYNTGDLARYHENGEVECLGRSDFQIKIRGYRIDLAEIESHIQELNFIKEVVVYYREGISGAKELIAYLIPQDVISFEEQFFAQVKQHIAAGLPEYMVPGLFVLLDSFPLTSNGKINKKALPQPTQKDKTYTAPINDKERLLCKIWSDLLHIDQVSVDGNFFSLGGDSIIVIQLIGKARQAGLIFTVKDFFSNQTIRQLASVATLLPSADAEQNTISGNFSILPIQYYLLNNPAFYDVSYNNHSKFFILNSPLNLQDLEIIIHAIFKQHDILRAVFEKKSHIWDGKYLDYNEELVKSALLYVDLDDLDEADWEECIDYCSAQAQASLDISSGEGIKFIFFNSVKIQRLFVVVHKLLFDESSWNILIADFQKSYKCIIKKQLIDLEIKTKSFRNFSDKNNTNYDTTLIEKEKKYWINSLSDIWLGLIPFDNKEFDYKDNINSNSGFIQIELSAEETTQLLESNHAYYTDTTDLLLAALLNSIQSHTNQRAIRLHFVNNIRELFYDIDVSRTIGNFTNAYPITLTSASSADTSDLIISVKEQAAKACKMSLGYGILNYILNDSDLTALTKDSNSWIYFNYSPQECDSNEVLGIQKIGQQNSLDKNPTDQREHFISFNGGVIDGKLQFTIDYNIYQYDLVTIQSIADGFQKGLGDIMDHCNAKEVAVHTPSDFPLVTVHQSEIDILQMTYASIQDIYPATGMQKGLLFHSTIEAGLYVNQLVFVINGLLDQDILKRSWELLIDEYSIFRTSFVGDFQNLYQLVSAHADLPWNYLDFSDKEISSQEEMFKIYKSETKAQGFEMNQAPLMNVHLVKFSDNNHRLIWNHHHAILDGWSFPIVWSKLSGYYKLLINNKSVKAATEKQSYAKYISWLQDQSVDAARVFWKRQLNGLETATKIPFQNNTLVGKSVYEEYALNISSMLSDKLQLVAKKTGITLNSIIQGMWAYLLYRYTQEKNICFGTTVSGRTSDIDEIEQMVGLFINTIPAVFKFADDDVNIDEYLKAVHINHQERDLHSYLPLIEIQKESIISGNDLFDTLIVFENYPLGDTLLKSNFGIDVTAGMLSYSGETNYKLTILAYVGSKLDLKIGYYSDTFNEDTIQKIGTHIIELLEGICENHRLPLSSLSLMNQKEVDHLLNDFNGETMDYDPTTCIHELFEAQAIIVPDAIAVEFEEEKITYQELNNRSNQLAHYLRSQGVQSDNVVGLCMSRSLNMIVCIMGIIKAGAAYLPLDPAYPKERLTHMIDTSQVEIILSESMLASVIEVPEFIHKIYVDVAEFKYALSLCSTYNVPKETIGLNSKNLAYTIYTSGSTGKPKGVMIEHFSLVQLIHWSKSQFSSEVLTKVLCCTSLNFDLSKFEIFLTLSTGNTVLLVTNAFDLVNDNVYNPTLINTVPSVISTLLDAGKIPDSTVVINLAGEPLQKELVNRIFNETRVKYVYNLYGPSEDTTYSSFVCFTQPIQTEPTIGKPIFNTTFLVLDDKHRLLPEGLPGELYIGGAGLARGYHNRPDLTAERFIANPFLNKVDSSNKLYKTGDIVRWLPIKELEFLGRKDYQVKIRGFRIELGEIESRLNELTNIDKAVAIVHEDSAGGKQLTAYCVLKEGLDIEEETFYIHEIKESLSHVLPNYMIPQAYTFIEKMPLNTSGKVDRNAFNNYPKKVTIVKDAGIVSPRNNIEETIASIWKKVLGLDSIGIFDAFNEVGGDSLKVIKVLSMLKDFGLLISTKDLYASKTIAEIAEKVNRNSDNGISAKVKDIKGIGYLMPFHFLYFKNIKYKTWNLSEIYFFEKGLNDFALVKVLESLVVYHDALRINFKGELHEKSNFKNVKMINLGSEEMQPDFLLIDWTSLSEEQFSKHVIEDIRLLENANTYESSHLAKFRLYRGADGDHFYICISHLICDEISMQLLRNDIFQWYEAASSGKEITYQRKTDSYLLASKSNFEFATSEAILNEVKLWEIIYQAFNNNILLPRDTVITDEEKKIKNHNIINVTLLSGEDLESVEEYCFQNKISVIDLFLVAWGRTIKKWSGIDTLGIMFVSAGRQYTFSDLDVSRTVGSFAIGNYMVIDSSDEKKTLAENAYDHKVNRSMFLNGGTASTILLEMPYYRDLHDIPPVVQKIPFILNSDIPYITVNYFDKRNSSKDALQDDLILSPMHDVIKKADQDLKSMDLFKLELYHSNDQLVLQWSYNALEYNAATINNMIEELKKLTVDVYV